MNFRQLAYPISSPAYFVIRSLIVYWHLVELYKKCLENQINQDSEQKGDPDFFYLAARSREEIKHNKQETASNVKTKTHKIPSINNFRKNDSILAKGCLTEISHQTGYIDSMNLYAAFNDNPVNFVDPMGQEFEIVFQYKSQEEIDRSDKIIKKAIQYVDEDFNNFKKEAKSWFKDPTNFVEYWAWWFDKYGKHTPALGAGLKMGTAVTGTTVSGKPISEIERIQRLHWGGLEFAFLLSAYATEPKPFEYKINPANDAKYNQVQNQGVNNQGQAISATKPNSRILAKNMENAGISRPPDSAAHHIVAGNDPRAAQVRSILIRENIGINEAENGIFFPKNLNAPNPNSATVHSIIHTNKYYNSLRRELINAVPGTIREVLIDIGDKILKGVFPF
jgi:hypothetical protein